MPDYSKGKIYKICSDDPDITEVYIGSTVQTLHKRWSCHISIAVIKCKKHASHILFEKYGVEPFHIELIQDYPCQSKAELERLEGKYQLEIKCVNIRVAGRTSKEWRTHNKEAHEGISLLYRTNNAASIKIKKAQHYADNRERIRKKETERCNNNREAIRAKQNSLIMCNCGMETPYSNLARHIRSKKHTTLLSALQ